MWDQVSTFFQPSLQAVLQREETQQPDLVLAVSTVIYLTNLRVLPIFNMNFDFFLASKGLVLLSLIYAIIINLNLVLCLDSIVSNLYEMTSKNSCL